MSIEWDGTGLPPVGYECEANINNSWIPVVVVANYDGFAFAWNYDYRISVAVNGINVHEYFRPIRTEAERKRSELCDRIYGAMTKADREGNRSDMAESVYDAIAAGEIPGIRLTDDAGS